jgi:hypothetical protein
MAVKCSNCERDAQYTQADPGANPANYCFECLPIWLRTRAEAGHFPLVAPVAEKPAVEKTTKKKTTSTAEETPAEEAPADENN